MWRAIFKRSGEKFRAHERETVRGTRSLKSAHSAIIISDVKDNSAQKDTREIIFLLVRAVFAAVFCVFSFCLSVPPCDYQKLTKTKNSHLSKLREIERNAKRQSE
jgi:maltodextrin utilization protein YvdJ